MTTCKDKPAHDQVDVVRRPSYAGSVARWCGQMMDPPGRGRAARINILEGRRVLLVEEVAVIADDLALTLQSFGCRVVGPVPNERQAVHAIDRHEVEAGVIDQHIGRLACTHLINRLGACAIPFVYTSGFIEGVDLHGFPPGPVLYKPVDPMELRRELELSFARAG